MADKVLMKGNEAIAEAAIMAGCRHYFGYPITPQTEVAAYMAKKMPRIGGVFLQAESEIASINMVYGAAGCGVRAMTSSSSPGISLKQEGISYLCGYDVPAVIADVMRIGSGLGDIFQGQGDYWQLTRGGGHGDYHPIVLAPASVQETVDLMQDAFDLADIYRTPVMILADGIIGQIMEPVEFHEKKETRELPAKDWAATGWSPASNRPRAIVNSLYIEVEELQELNDRLQARYQHIRENESRAELYNTEGAEIIVCAYGTVARICKAAIGLCAKQGVKVGLFRPITAWPFPEKQLAKAMAQDSVKKAIAVEISAGQMLEDVKLTVNGTKPVEFYGKPGSYTPTAEEIAEYIMKSREA